MEPDKPTAELLEGLAPFAARATELVAGAYKDIALLSQDLNERVYATEAFVAAVRKFVLQHSHTKLRVLVNDGRRAIAGGSRFVEFGRKMSSFIEFRELLPERRPAVLEEYLIADGKVMLYREAPGDLEAKFYGNAPQAARLKLKDFDILWNESTTAQELRQLGI